MKLRKSGLQPLCNAHRKPRFNEAAAMKLRKLIEAAEVEEPIEVASMRPQR